MRARLPSSAHVSAVPNHQVGRITSIDTRAAVAFFGVFGYELDPTTIAEADRRRIRAQIEWYKQHRDVLQRGLGGEALVEGRVLGGVQESLRQRDGAGRGGRHAEGDRYEQHTDVGNPHREGIPVL